MLKCESVLRSLQMIVLILCVFRVIAMEKTPPESDNFELLQHPSKQDYKIEEVIDKTTLIIRNFLESISGLAKYMEDNVNKFAQDDEWCEEKVSNIIEKIQQLNKEINGLKKNYDDVELTQNTFMMHLAVTVKYLCRYALIHLSLFWNNVFIDENTLSFISKHSNVIHVLAISLHWKEKDVSESNAVKFSLAFLLQNLVEYMHTRVLTIWDKNTLLVEPTIPLQNKFNELISLDGRYTKLQIKNSIVECSLSVKELMSRVLNLENISNQSVLLIKQLMMDVCDFEKYLISTINLMKTLKNASKAFKKFSSKSFCRCNSHLQINEIPDKNRLKEQAIGVTEKFKHLLTKFEKTEYGESIQFWFQLFFESEPKLSVKKMGILVCNLAKILGQDLSFIALDESDRKEIPFRIEIIESLIIARNDETKSPYISLELDGAMVILIYDLCKMLLKHFSIGASQK